MIARSMLWRIHQVAQVEQHDAAVDVVLGDRHHQAQVMLDHGLASRKVARLGQGRVMHFLLGRQQRPGTDLVQVMLGGIGRQLGRENLLQLVDAGQHDVAVASSIRVLGPVRFQHDLIHPLVGKLVRGSVVVQRVRWLGH
jgi:hypothetical protein